MLKPKLYGSARGCGKDLAHKQLLMLKIIKKRLLINRKSDQEVKFNYCV